MESKRLLLLLHSADLHLVQNPDGRIEQRVDEGGWISLPRYRLAILSRLEEVLDHR